METSIKVGDFIVGKQEKEIINKVLDSNRISEGKYTREFEKKWARYIGTKYSIALNSGTSALIAGLTALKHINKDVYKKRKVITSPLTYIATSNALVLSNFEPVYVDVNEETFGITPDNIKQHLEEIDDTSEYSIILPVHLMGYPCDMDEINKIAEKYDTMVFEDSAQAHGTIYKGKQTGSLSALSVFSFYIAHNIQAGELGAVNTDDNELIKMIRKIKANGRQCDCHICTRNTTGCPKTKTYKGEKDYDPRFTHEIIGYNFKTMDFNTALALTQLKKADWIKQRRSENVRYLNEGLSKFSHILKLPKFSKHVSYLAYPIILKKDISRKKIRQELEKKRIESRPLFGCIPTQQPAYSHLKKQYEKKLPIAEHLGSQGFYIGCHQYLTQADLDYIIKTFKEVLK